MNKSHLTILGLGSLVTVVLVAVWLISFLDVQKDEVTEQPILPTEENNQNITEASTEIMEISEQPAEKIYDLNQVRSNGQPMEIPEGADLTVIPESEKSLLRSDSSGGTPEGWNESTWPKEIPAFDEGNIKSILKSNESAVWMLLIANTTEEDIDKYAEKLNNNGWAISSLEDNEDGYYGVNAKKGDWETIIIYNPEVSETMISAAKGVEIQN